MESKIERGAPVTEWIRLLAEKEIEYSIDCPLASYNTFRIGGVASLALFPKTKEQLISAVELVARDGGKYAVVGKGSNLLFPDGRYQGTVVFTSRVRELSLEGDTVVSSAGVSLSALASHAARAGLSGLEFAAGIPGTVGGAVLMNAGAFGGEMAQVTVSSEYWDAENARCGCFEGEEQCFGTRTSVYATHPKLTVLSATFRLQKGDSEDIRARMEEYRERRCATQPLDFPNAGSIFKHPKGYFAGKLIEDCGLKGMRVGDAEVSLKHAGFIVNRGNATSEDVKRLIETVRERVMQRYGIALECELRFLE